MGREIMEKTPPPADSVERYGPGPEQVLEIRRPAGPGPHPAVVLIHGGFWRPHRDLRHMSHIAARLASEGIASANIEYRRVGQPGGGWPGTLDDVRAAALHVRGVEGFDFKKLVVAGFSAGAQLALWLVAERVLPVRGAIAMGGALDLTRIHELDLGDGAVAGFLGGSPDQVRERYRAACPKERVPLGVPQRVLHGASDEVVPVEIARRYRDAARAAGDDVRLVEIEGADHHDMIDPASRAWPEVRGAFPDLLGLGQG